jgi:hypothetical protein
VALQDGLTPQQFKHRTSINNVPDSCHVVYKILRCLLYIAFQQATYVRSKAYLCGRALAGIMGLNPTGGMDICLLCVFVLSGRGLCDGPIPRPEESHRLWCVSECYKVKIKKPRHLLRVGRRGKDYETKRNETKRNETKRNETKRSEAKRNKTKRNETKLCRR